MRIVVTLTALPTILVTLLCVAHPAGGEEDDATRLARDSRTLTALLPKLLGSSDVRMVHEAIRIVRADSLHGVRRPPETYAQLIAALDRLLREPEDKQATTRRLACSALASHRVKDAVPVLLRALDDPYEKTDLASRGSAGAPEHVWYAVWRSADDALREITGASPIDKPEQLTPIPGQREAVRHAWLEWARKRDAKGEGEGAIK
ncbi:MAG: hypothetical protein ACYSX0_07665 [Planctomycetota bacterium]